jgi:transposase
MGLIHSSRNSYGQKRRIHLHHQPRLTKKRGRVDYYSLATCFYEDGKNRKKILYGVGELTHEEAEKYRIFLNALNGDVALGNVIDFEQIVYQEDKAYLDVLAIDLLWKEFELDKIFDSQRNNNQKLSTEHVARILTVNKLLAPAAKVKTVPWFRSTLLPVIMGVDPDDYDKNKVFRELSNIHAHKPKLEKHFLEFSKKSKGEYEAYYFDGTTSWFEGSKCALAKYDVEKTRGFFDQVIGFMLITDNLGFPVAWEVVDGNTKDTTAFKTFIERISRDYSFKEITYCFDRGVASVKNFDLVKKFEGKFISGIKDNQIKDVLNLQNFRITRAKITDKINELEEGQQNAPRTKRRVIDIDGFLSFNDKTYFKDLGIVGDKRYIASFKFDLFIKESFDRDKRIKEALLAISDKNTELAEAKRERDFNTTERDLLDLLKRYRVKEFFGYTLSPRVSSHKAATFEIKCDLNRSKVDAAQLTDGLLIYITDHIEKTTNGQFKLLARDIVSHYRGKYVVENAFREMKSFLDLRPIHVWTETHVKAHFDIGIIAYFINNYIYRKLVEHAVSTRDFQKQLRDSGRVVKIAAPTGLEIYKLKRISKQLKACFDALKISQITSPTLHKAHGISQ